MPVSVLTPAGPYVGILMNREGRLAAVVCWSPADVGELDETEGEPVVTDPAYVAFSADIPTDVMVLPDDAPKPSMEALSAAIDSAIEEYRRRVGPLMTSLALAVPPRLGAGGAPVAPYSAADAMTLGGAARPVVADARATIGPPRLQEPSS